MCDWPTIPQWKLHHLPIKTKATFTWKPEPLQNEHQHQRFSLILPHRPIARPLVMSFQATAQKQWPLIGVRASKATLIVSPVIDAKFCSRSVCGLIGREKQQRCGDEGKWVGGDRGRGGGWRGEGRGSYTSRRSDPGGANCT